MPAFIEKTARSGILSSEDELLRLNSIISPLVESGQSVHQIYKYMEKNKEVG